MWFCWHIIPKMWCRNYSQTLSWKVKIRHNSGAIVWNFIKFVFIVCQVEDYRKILKLSCKPLALKSSKAFSKNKKRYVTSLPASFLGWFLKKNISLAIFYYMTRFRCLVGFTWWGTGQYMHCNCFLTRFRGQTFWN